MKNTESPVSCAAQALNLELEHPKNLKDELTINSIKAMNLDLIIVIAYGFIIPKEILRIPNMDAIIFTHPYFLVGEGLHQFKDQ